MTVAARRGAGRERHVDRGRTAPPRAPRVELALRVGEARRPRRGRGSRPRRPAAAPRRGARPCRGGPRKTPFLPRKRGAKVLERPSSTLTTMASRANPSRAPRAVRGDRRGPPTPVAPSRRGEVGGEREREVREDLAVDRDAGLDQARDQARVGRAVLARGGVDADDPERAEVAALLAAIARGVVGARSTAWFARR